MNVKDLTLDRLRYSVHALLNHLENYPTLSSYEAVQFWSEKVRDQLKELEDGLNERQ